MTSIKTDEYPQIVVAHVSSDCTCENEEGQDPSCFDGDCYLYDKSFVTDDLVPLWLERNGKADADSIYVNARNLGWTHGTGEGRIDRDDLFKLLELNGDFSLRFHLNGKNLTVVRTSHDEPGGATYELAPLLTK
jgi:hypothetical protein